MLGNLSIFALSLFYHLSSYCVYAYYQGLISQKEYVDLLSKIKNDPTDKYYEQERDICINELINHNELLSNYYRKYIDLYNSVFIPKENDAIIDHGIYPLFQKFLKYMNCHSLYYSL